MEFTAYNFENNGDIFGMSENGKLTYVGRCDSDGDIRIESDFSEMESEIEDCLKMTVKSALAGGIDWTPDACFLKAVGERRLRDSKDRQMTKTTNTKRDQLAQECVRCMRDVLRVGHSPLMDQFSASYLTKKGEAICKTAEATMSEETLLEIAYSAISA